MKTIVCLLACIASAHALTVTAGFDQLPRDSTIGKAYEENGLVFGSPADIITITGHFGAVLFGGGGYQYIGNALFARSDGWLSLGAGGQLMESVGFKYGHDWNFYAIEYGLLTTELEWQKWAGGELIAQGGFGQSRGHGGIMVEIPEGDSFDQLLLRSTATVYQWANWNSNTQTWERGPSSWTPANHIAIDSVTAQIAESAPFERRGANRVPDSGAWVVLLAFAGLLALRRWVR